MVDVVVPEERSTQVSALKSRLTTSGQVSSSQLGEGAREVILTTPQVEKGARRRRVFQKPWEACQQVPLLRLALWGRFVAEHASAHQGYQCGDMSP